MMTRNAQHTDIWIRIIHAGVCVCVWCQKPSQPCFSMRHSLVDWTFVSISYFIVDAIRTFHHLSLHSTYVVSSTLQIKLISIRILFQVELPIRFSILTINPLFSDWDRPSATFQLLCCNPLFLQNDFKLSNVDMNRCTTFRRFNGINVKSGNWNQLILNGSEQISSNYMSLTAKTIVTKHRSK